MFQGQTQLGLVVDVTNSKLGDANRCGDGDPRISNQGNGLGLLTHSPTLFPRQVNCMSLVSFSPPVHLPSRLGPKAYFHLYLCATSPDALLTLPVP